MNFERIFDEVQSCHVSSGRWFFWWFLIEADEFFNPPWGIQGSAARNAWKGYNFGGGQSIFLGGTWIHRARWFWCIFFGWLNQLVDVWKRSMHKTQLCLTWFTRAGSDSTDPFRYHGEVLPEAVRRLQEIRWDATYIWYHSVLFFAFYIILCHVLSTNIIISWAAATIQKEHSAKKQKAPNSACSKIPPQVHFEGIPLFFG